MPPLSPPTFHRSRNTALYAGTNFSLNCLVSLNETIRFLDTDFTIQSNITGPGTFDLQRITVSQPLPVGGGVYETVLRFSRLLESDSGVYNCSVMLIPAQSNIIAGDSVSAIEHISVGRKYHAKLHIKSNS